MRNNKRLDQLQVIKDLVVEERKFLPRLGTRKLYYLLKSRWEQQGLKIGRDKLFALLKAEHLLIKSKRSYTKTTMSKHWLRKYPNLLKTTIPTGVEQVWVSDITYVQTKAAHTYLALITDAYSRKIVGYSLNADLRTEGIAQALKMAIKTRKANTRLIHHSDRGIQYCSALYQQQLHKAGIRPSMTDGYDCYQNAMAERINGIIKEEFLITKTNNINELEKIVHQSIKIYNQRRPHLALDMLTPEIVHKKSLAAYAARENN